MPPPSPTNPSIMTHRPIHHDPPTHPPRPCCSAGILRGGYGRLWIAPPGDTRLGPHDDVMVCRPSMLPLKGAYEPLVQPVQVDSGACEVKLCGVNLLVWSVFVCAELTRPTINGAL